MYLDLQMLPTVLDHVVNHYPPANFTYEIENNVKTMDPYKAPDLDDILGLLFRCNGNFEGGYL